MKFRDRFTRAILIIFIADEILSIRCYFLLSLWSWLQSTFSHTHFCMAERTPASRNARWILVSRGNKCLAGQIGFN